jgi:hypothetical protein
MIFIVSVNTALGRMIAPSVLNSFSLSARATVWLLSVSDAREKSPLVSVGRYHTEFCVMA